MRNILSHFGVQADDKDISPLGSGLINDTFKVNAGGHCYVLQRVNHHIFCDVDALQRNIDAVTAHIRRKITEKGGDRDAKRATLRFLDNTATGKSYYFDGDCYWRVSEYIDGTFTRTTVNEENAFKTGKAFGDFQRLLSDLPEQLVETIPDFHNMDFRLRQFKEALASDAAGRKGGVSELTEALLARAGHACLAERLHEKGLLPKRICHCDTKVDNILFDKEGNVVCVIDLDTVMPSFVFSDFGDFLRSAANTGKEDDLDPDNIEFDMSVFRPFARGYMESAGAFLTEVEKGNLPYAAERFAYMQSVRFLTDYLNGDIYYKTAYPEHNLVRAKAQFKLLQSIESHLDEMKDYISHVSS